MTPQTTPVDHFAKRPCINRCIIEGTENNPQPDIAAATHGNYCDNEFKQIKRALDRAPGMVEHIISMLTANSNNDDRVDGSRDAPLPFNLEAFSDANETYQRLVFWSVIWADLMGVQAPGPAKRAWRNRSGQIIGLPNNIAPDQARYIVGIMCTWLKLHLDQILTLGITDVSEWQIDLRDVYRLNAKWPTKARARYSDMPCPKQECRGRIAVFPPDKFEDEERITCESCGQWFPPEQYEHLIAVFKQIRAERNATTRHLMRKYGN